MELIGLGMGWDLPVVLLSDTLEVRHRGRLMVKVAEWWSGVVDDLS
ncbi:MAG TPA: hypothetical protein VK111_14280 [Virgibacillus sp.]|nr:hypothetical protein [Virgibacillus sp.]